MGLTAGPLKLEESQAAAAVGQIALARAYQAMFAERGINAAQILLTLGETEARRRYLNARSTISTLLALGAVPVVNENDTIATAEIRYGDNDRLAARVGSMMSADCIVLLSDIDGLYTAPPALDPQASRLDVVEEITPAIEAMAGDAGQRAVARRHGHEDRRGEDRRGCGRQSGYRQRQDFQSRCARWAKARRAHGSSHRRRR